MTVTAVDRDNMGNLFIYQKRHFEKFEVLFANPFETTYYK